MAPAIAPAAGSTGARVSANHEVWGSGLGWGTGKANARRDMCQIAEQQLEQSTTGREQSKEARSKDDDRAHDGRDQAAYM